MTAPASNRWTILAMLARALLATLAAIEQNPGNHDHRVDHEG
jgi:hypothetical protein